MGDDLYNDLVRRLPAPPQDQSLEALCPEVSDQWDGEKNAPLTPDLFTPGSGECAWWKCASGHSWKAAISARCRGSGCPYCSKVQRTLSNENSLARRFPDIAREWNFDRNSDLGPDQIVAGSGRAVWWRCSKGHEWESSPGYRTRTQTGCPFCSNRRVAKSNSLASEFPALLTEWNHEKNDKDPSTIAPRSDYKAWWTCSKCGHEWQARVYSRAQGRGCIKCSYANGSRRRKP
jgi:glutaredoxin